MPVGIYIRTKEHNKKISDRMKMLPSNRLGKKGYKATAEHRLKLSIAKSKENLSRETRLKMSESHKGDKHWNWRGGECIRNKKQYFDINYRLWREEVFRRDKYKCRNCGISGVYITAHHIKSWKNYPDMRYEVSNGLTLCEKCHSLTDNYKGRVNNKCNKKL